MGWQWWQGKGRDGHSLGMKLSCELLLFLFLLRDDFSFGWEEKIRFRKLLCLPDTPAFPNLPSLIFPSFPLAVESFLSLLSPSKIGGICWKTFSRFFSFALPYPSPLNGP